MKISVIAAFLVVLSGILTCPTGGQSQVFVQSLLEADQNHQVRATCTTSMQLANNDSITVETTDRWYAGVGTVCTVSDGKKVISRNDLPACAKPSEQGDPVTTGATGKPIGKCQFTFSAEPGLTYTLTAKHYLLLNPNGGVYPNGQCGQGQFADPQAWWDEGQTKAVIPGPGEAPTSETHADLDADFPLDRDGPDCFDQSFLSSDNIFGSNIPPGAMLLATTTAEWKSMNVFSVNAPDVDKKVATLFQRMTLQLHANPPPSSSGIDWCITHLNTCVAPSGGTGPGRIEPNDDGANYAAPETIANGLPGAVDIAWGACADDRDEPLNFDCVDLVLDQLGIQVGYDASNSGTYSQLTNPAFVSIRSSQGQNGAIYKGFQGTIQNIAEHYPANTFVPAKVSPLWENWELTQAPTQSGSKGSTTEPTIAYPNARTSTSSLAYLVPDQSTVVTFTAKASVDLTGIGDGSDGPVALSTPTVIDVNYGRTPQTIDQYDIGGSPFHKGGVALLTAHATSGNPVSFTSLSTNVCDISGWNTAYIIDYGTCVVEADQPGDSTFAAAPPLVKSFTTVSSGVPNNPDNPNNPGTPDNPQQPADPNEPNKPINLPEPPVTLPLFPPLPNVFGPTPTATASPTQSVDFMFSQSTQLGDIIVLTQGVGDADFQNANSGSCVLGQTYNSGDICSVDIAFTPLVNGARNGAVVLNDSSGHAVAQGYLQGVGVGPLLNFSPGTETTVSVSSLSGPMGTAVDDSGNVYISDTANGRVLKETFTAGAYTESTVSTTSLTGPEGIALDGRGNLYIADAGSNRVIMEAPTATGYVAALIPTSTLSSPNVVAVDAAGNIYIADSGNNRVLEEVRTNKGYYETTVTTSPLNYPFSVAVDANSNVYVADMGNNRILKETISGNSYSESVVPTSSLNGPTAIAVDGNNNLYIADSGNNRLLKEAFSDGNYVESTIQNTASFVAGLAVDGRGNVYIPDLGNNQVLKEDFSDPPSLTFAPTPLGSTSSDSPRSMTVSNVGSSTLNLTIPSSGNNPSIGVGFTLNSSSPEACPVVNSGSSAEGAVPAGQSCSFAISFTPIHTGSEVSALVLWNNFANGTQSIALHGEGTGSTSQTITFGPIEVQQANSTIGLTAAASSGLPVSLQSLTMAVCSVSGVAATLISEGTCTIEATQRGNATYATAPAVTQSFTVNLASQTIDLAAIPPQMAGSSMLVGATASSGLPVVLTSSTPTVCLLSGSTLALLIGGTCSIQADQPGNSAFMAAPSVVESFAVNLAPQTITFPPIEYSGSISAASLVATSSAGLAVTFISVTPNICLVNEASAVPLGPGTCTIDADQGGNAIYAPAPPISQSFTVNVPQLLAGWNFETVSVGNSRASGAMAFTFTQSTAMGGVDVLSQGVAGLDFVDAGRGTCFSGAVYNPGDSCSVVVSFKPVAPGTRYGAVVLRDASMNAIATGYLQGTGISPQISFLPSAELTIQTSTLQGPQGITVDAGGTIYIADTGNNRIVKVTPSDSGFLESVIPTSTLAWPSGIAIDGSGVLFIADTSNNRVLKETPSGNTYVETTVATSALEIPNMVATDGSGNLYIVDSNNNRVLKESVYDGGYRETVIPTSSLNNPLGVAVDGSGNIYIADTFNNRIVKESPSSAGYTESVVPASTLNYPSAVSVDGKGNLLIANSYDSRILKEMPSPGGYIESSVATTGAYIYGVASDASGNIYVADFQNGRVLKEDFADPPSLIFTPASPGSTSDDSPQIVTVENVGNDALSFPIPNSGRNPNITGDFNLSSSGTPACPVVPSGASTNGTLAAGQTCQLKISFIPTATGASTGGLTLTDNSRNTTTTQSVQLQGIGTGSETQTITFGAIAEQVVYTSISLTAGASSGLPVRFVSFTPSTCTVGGTTATLIGGGTCSIQATQLGNATFAAARPVINTFTVDLLAQTITFSAIPSQLMNVGVAVPLYAYPNSYLPINFTTTTPSVCTVWGQVAMVTASSPAAMASLHALGTCTIQANQPGDGVVFSAASEVTQSFAVVSLDTPNTLSFGPTNIGSTSPVLTVTVRAGAAGVLGSISVMTRGSIGIDFTTVAGGTCAIAASYNAGDTCTVNVTFTPTLPGSSLGAVLLQDSAGTALGTAYLQGIGVGPAISFEPGTETTIPSSPLNRPSGIAIDRAGDIFIADSANRRVLKETLSGTSYIESEIHTSNAFWPSSVAVDGAGNVYIVDAWNGLILKESPSGGGLYLETVVPTGGLRSPIGIAVDGNGNLFVADVGNGDRLLVESPSGTTYFEREVPTSLSDNPFAMAVDQTGNVYIADTFNARILLESFSDGEYTEKVIPTSAWSPNAISVDSNGSIYVADKYGYSTGDAMGYGRLLKEALISGAYVESTLPSSALLEPNGLAIDGRGNIYVADTYNQRVLKEDVADPPSLDFLAAPIGSQSDGSPQLITISNSGNAPLVFAVPSDGTNPNISANFVLNQTGSASDCPISNLSSRSAATLQTGSSCTMSISFIPTTTGPISGWLELTDNYLNAPETTQLITLAGAGSQPTQTSQSISFATPPSPVAYGVAPIALSAMATSKLPVMLTVLSGPATITGSTLTITGAGSVVIAADQAGDSSYSAAPEVTESIVVNQAGQTIDFPASASPVFYGVSPTTLFATASSGLPVTFSVLSGPAAVSGSTLMITGAGTVVVAANQTGNANYTTAPQITQTVLVNPVAQTITFMAPTSPVNYGVSPITLVATATSGLPISFSIISGPATISGSTLTIIGGGTVMVAANQAGNANYSTAPQITQTVLVNPVAQTITFTAPTSPVNYGVSPITFVATATSGLPIRFSIISGPATISGSALTITGTGTVVVAANQAGNANYSIAPQVTQTIIVNSAGDAAIQLQFASVQLVYPGATNVTVCISPAAHATPTGTVQIYDGTTLLNTLTLDGGGCIYWYISPGLTAGSHAMTAVYSGDSNNPAGTSAPVTVTVSPVPVNMNVSCWNSSFSYGGDYQCTVGLGSNGGSPQGSITYSLDSGSLSPVVISGGSAGFKIPLPGAGNHQVVVAYAQQSNYAAATPQIETFTVTPAPVNISLTPSTWNAAVAANVTFQVAVTSWSAGPPNATGNVSFYDGGNLLATVPVNASGQASYSTAGLSAGSHAISATYANGTNYASSSTSISITVIQ